jgi:hypothetical protein
METGIRRPLLVRRRESALTVSPRPSRSVKSSVSWFSSLGTTRSVIRRPHALPSWARVSETSNPAARRPFAPKLFASHLEDKSFEVGARQVLADIREAARQVLPHAFLSALLSLGIEIRPTEGSHPTGTATTLAIDICLTWPRRRRRSAEAEKGSVVRRLASTQRNSRVNSKDAANRQS